jgi:hypothetical protein
MWANITLRLQLRLLQLLRLLRLLRLLQRIMPVFDNKFRTVFWIIVRSNLLNVHPIPISTSQTSIHMRSQRMY